MFERRQGEARRRLHTMALGGARYTFESGTDLRVEVLLNEPGWSEEELLRAPFAAASTGELAPYLAPGLELLGRHIAYASLRLPELAPQDRLTVQLRYAHSLTDGSGAAFVSTTPDATDSLVLFLSAFGSHGDEAGEFSRLVRGALVLGAVHTW